MNDEAFLSLINQGQTVAAVLIALGMAGLLLGEFVSRPVSRRLMVARDTEIAQLRRDSEAFARDASERLAAAQTREEEANSRAEHERTARVRIQEQASRRLSRDQQASIASALRSYAGQKVTLVAQSGDPESVRLTDDIVAALGQRGAGWDVFRFSASPASTPVSGILIESNPEATEAARVLATALAAQTTEVAGPRPFPETSAGGSTPIRVTIGRKP